MIELHHNHELRQDFFPRMIREKGYKIGIEIGVRAGAFSSTLCDSLLETVYGLDILWHPEVQNVINKYPKYKYLTGDSNYCYVVFEDNYFDFIYIDADHSYEAVKLDLEGWWPKLKAGGMFCGDDYIDFKYPGDLPFEVVPAVEEFASKYNLEVFTTGCSRENRVRFSVEQGNEHIKSNRRESHNFKQTPNWYIVK